MSRGVGWLKTRILMWQLASLALLVGSGFAIAGEVQMDSEPGILAVLYVVMLGLSVAALLFHSIRRRAVGRLTEVDQSDISDHLRINEVLHGDEPIPAQSAA